MKYVPNLIPASSKVLPNYFKGSPYNAARSNKVVDIIMWVLGGFFFLSAVGAIDHPLMFFIFGLIGFILIPPGHKLLEKKLRFKLTHKIKTFAVSALFLGSIPLTVYYAEIDQHSAYQQKLLDEKTAKEKALAEQKEQQRKDSLVFFIHQSNLLIKEHKINEADKQLQYALSFAANEADKEQIKKNKIDIETVKIADLITAGNHQAALPAINDLIISDPTNTGLLYNRAICYSKAGEIQKAVNDLKLLIQAGYPDAEELHNKINPLRKRVAYYVTRCWDGSTSNAKGRGACSHHGGVKNWNEPVYEEYRKYE